MFITALLMVTKTWKRPKCPSIDNWIKKWWYIYTMEYHSAKKRDEILPFVTTWMDLEIIMLSEISQKKLRTIFHSYVGYNTESKNKHDKQTETHGHR